MRLRAAEGGNECKTTSRRFETGRAEPKNRKQSRQLPRGRLHGPQPVGQKPGSRNSRLGGDSVVPSHFPLALRDRKFRDSSANIENRRETCGNRLRRLILPVLELHLRRGCDFSQASSPERGPTTNLLSSNRSGQRPRWNEPVRDRLDPARS
jgi:hypothetical protein